MTRENLVELGTQLAHEEGPDFLAKKILATVTTPLAMITGMRQLAQINFLRKNAHLILLSVDADPAIRFARAVERKKQGEATTLTEFVAHEQVENSGHHVQRLFECMKLGRLFHRK